MASTSFTSPPSSPSRGLPPSPPRPVGAAHDLSAMRLFSRDLPSRTSSGELQERSPFGSPARKRKPAEPLGTPSPVKTLRGRLGDIAELNALDRQDQAVVRDAIQALGALPDTPQRCVRARRVSSLIEELAKTAFPASSAPAQAEEAPPSRRTCVGLTNDESDMFAGSWPEKALARLNRIYADCRHRLGEDNPLFVVNLGHLMQSTLRGQVSVGLHMSSPESRNLEKTGSLRTVALNPLTGVRAVEYRAIGSKKPKISTFFPDTIRRPEDLLDILSDGEIIRQEGERCLMVLPRERYHVELYLHDHFHVRSCFPVFYYAPFNPDASYQITEDIRRSADDILNYCQRAAETNTAYRTKTTVTIDIGPVMDGCPIQKGIYIEIDPKLL